MNRLIKFRVWDKDRRIFLKDRNLSLQINIHGRVCLVNEAFTTVDFITQQFTGLLDKYGKEIYEGDIFKGGAYKWDPVKFENGKFTANLRGARVFDLSELLEDGNAPVVLGNVFENPELITK